MSKEYSSTHFGVYGVCIKNKKILCIEKNSGPYKGRYDLPGGSQILGESLVETLSREFKEETGLSISEVKENRIYDVFVRENKDNNLVHHIFALYTVKYDENSQITIPELVQNERNDSNGTKWIDFSSLHQENASPILLKAVNVFNNADKSVEAERYLNWIVKN